MAETTAGRLAHNLVERQETINRELARNGVRFGIYRDGTYHDRLFPYDPVSRLIPSDEFDRLEAGLKQRVSALNAFLRDVYSDKRIVRDGVVPEEFVYTSKGYLLQVNGMTPPAGIYAHVAGEDLVQGEDGSWWVLEDNLRIPSGASYPLFVRDIERNADPRLFHENGIRDNRDYPPTPAPRHGLRLHARRGRGALAGPLQLGLLRAHLPRREDRGHPCLPRGPRGR